MMIILPGYGTPGIFMVLTDPHCNPGLILFKQERSPLEVTIQRALILLGLLRERTFSIYPNPVSEILHISSGLSPAGSFVYRIFDLSGALKISGNLDGDRSGEVDTSPLSPGIYLISFDAHNFQENHKFIVTR